MKKIKLLVTFLMLFTYANSQESIVEGFDSETFLPDGWGSEIPDNMKIGRFTYGGQETGQDAYARISAKNYEVNTGSALLYTSKITVEANQSYDYSFWVKTSSYYNTKYKFTYGASQTQSNQINILVDESEEGIRANMWTEVKGTFTPTENGDIYFAYQVFYTKGNLSLDGILIRKTPTCTTVNSTEITDITQTTAKASWEHEATNAQEYKIKVVTENADVNSDAVFEADVTTKSVDIIGLSPITSYDLYIKTNCGTTDGLSEWTNKISFKTLCGAVESINENFDSVPYNQFPSCWSKILEGPYAAQGYTNILSDGNGKLKFTYFDNAITDKVILITPEVTTLEANATYRLKFKIKSDCTDCNNEIVEVGTITDPNDKNTYTKFKEYTFGDQEIEITTDFSTYTGTDKYIAINRPTNGNLSAYIDDVVWEKVSPPECTELISPKSTGLAAVNNLKLVWEKIESATAYNIKIGKTEGADDVLATTKVTENTYTLTTTLDYSTKYYVSIIPENENGTSQNCNIEEIMTTHNPNYGGGTISAIYGGYYFANNTPEASPAKNQPTYNWFDPITENHTQITNWTTTGDGTDNYSYTINDLQFNLNFFGEDYGNNNIHINSNGAIFFGNEATGIDSTLVIPAEQSSLKSYVAGAFTDYVLKEDISKIYRHSEADRYIITWYKVYNNSTHEIFKNEYISFQIVLHKNGNIRVMYNDELSYTDEIGNNSENESIQKKALVGIINQDGKKGISYRSQGEPGTISAAQLALMFTKQEETVSTNDINIHDSKLRVYPNPVKDILMVSGESKVNSITVYNLSGKKVIESNNTKFISFTRLPKGLYLVNIKTEKETKTIKVIKK